MNRIARRRKTQDNPWGAAAYKQATPDGVV